MEFLVPGAKRNRPLGYQQLASLGTAQALTVPAGTEKIVVIASVQAVRWRDDSVDPSAAVGMLLPVSTYYTFTNTSFTGLKFIEVTAGGVLDVSYYGQ